MKTTSHLLTQEEAEILNILGDVFNKFLNLPKLHPNLSREFCAAIHSCQEKVMMRPVLREINGTCPTVPSFKGAMRPYNEAHPREDGE